MCLEKYENFVKFNLCSVLGYWFVIIAQLLVQLYSIFMLKMYSLFTYLISFYIICNCNH